MPRLLRPWALASQAAAVCLALAPAARAEDKKSEKDPHAELIGKKAPDLEGNFAIDGKPVKLSDLKGKVVMLDFWAVWCGPCIATFPHLRDWQSEYKDKGLEIVGVTTYYGIPGFDKEKASLQRADKGVEVSSEKEQGMLKDFVAHHKLQHKIMTLTKEGWKASCGDYKVQGIPTVVLIDKKGNVQMVKVGSGDENAKALEAKIKELIAE